jgi:hypothetical protein
LNEKLVILAKQSGFCLDGGVNETQYGTCVETALGYFAEKLIKETLKQAQITWLKDNSTFPTAHSDLVLDYFGIKHE